MEPMNPTASSILDQAAQKLLDATYEEYKINQRPLSQQVEAIRQLPKDQQEDAMHRIVAEVRESGSMNELIHLALDGMQAAERRKQAKNMYCQARAMAEQMGLQEVQNA